MTRNPLVKTLLIAIALAVTLLGVWGLVQDLRSRPVQFITVSFHAIFPVAGFFVLQLGRGKIRQGPAITLLCAAGAVGVGGVFGYLASGRPGAFISSHWPTVAAGAIAGLLTLIAALEVLLRAPRQTLPRVALGFAFLFPLMVLTAMTLRGTIARAMTGLPDGLSFGLYVLLLIVLIALTAGAGHHIIRAFQIGVAAFKDEPPQTPPAPALATRPTNEPEQAGSLPATPPGAQG